MSQNAKTMPPAVWWQTYGKHLPNISKVAQTVLAQPSSASSGERNWSVYGHIKSKNRSRLTHHTADKLVFCHEALHLRDKLQRAQYVQTVEQWQLSDSDTDDEVAEAGSPEDSDDESMNAQAKKAALIRRLAR